MPGLSYKEAVKLHGSNGPFLAIGYQAGLYAMKLLKPETIMDLACEIEVLPKKPFTCIIDGIQASSCCTIGKGNLIVNSSDSMLALIKFENRRTKEFVKLKVKKKIWERALSAQDLSKEASTLCKLKPEELFEVLCTSGH